MELIYQVAIVDMSVQLRLIPIMHYYYVQLVAVIVLTASIQLTITVLAVLAAWSSLTLLVH